MNYNTVIKTGNKHIKLKDYDKCLSLYESFKKERPDNEEIDDKIIKIKRIIQITTDINKKQSEFYYYKSLQLALKLVLNGVYGAFANKHFVLSNSDIANSVTAMGRTVIQYTLMKIEDYFYNQWHNNKSLHKLLGSEYIAKKDGKYYFLDKRFTPIDRPYDNIDTGDNTDILHSRGITLQKLKPMNKTVGDFEILYEYFICDFSNVKPLDENPKFEIETVESGEKVKMYKGENRLIIYGDTDSIHSLSVVYVKNKKVTIEDLYNKNLIKHCVKNINNKEYVNCDEMILNWTEDKKIHYSSVKKLIRHKVTKEKWEIKLKSGETIQITNDHSMVVFRNGKQLTIKPKDINTNTDKILKIIT